MPCAAELFRSVVGAKRRTNVDLSVRAEDASSSSGVGRGVSLAGSVGVIAGTEPSRTKCSSSAGVLSTSTRAVLLSTRKVCATPIGRPPRRGEGERWPGRGSRLGSLMRLQLSGRGRSPPSAASTRSSHAGLEAAVSEHPLRASRPERCGGYRTESRASLSVRMAGRP